MFGFSSPFSDPNPPSRRPRNPRFAPELLERRLMLSTMIKPLSATQFGPLSAAQFSPVKPATAAQFGPVKPPQNDPDPLPNPDGTPQIEPLPIPCGPLLPA